jgi:hypothetical protein
MKKLLKYILLALTLSVLVSSCKKEEEVPPKSKGEKIGEEIKKSFATNYYDGIIVYQNGGLIALDFDFEIDKQYLIFPDNNGNYYKFDLNKLIYYKYGDNIELIF